MNYTERFIRLLHSVRAMLAPSCISPPPQTETPAAGHWIMQKGDRQGVVNRDLCFQRGISLKWVHTAEKGEDGTALERIPVEQTSTYTDGKPFRAAGRDYASLEQLTVEKDERSVWCRDIYGREVFCVAERFPCFDSYDFLYDNRCYRWFYIRENGRLTCIYHADGENKITVTEDMGMLGRGSWDSMLREGYVQEKREEISSG